MIKYVNQRGGFFNYDDGINSDNEKLFDDVLNEMDALAKVYDIVKSMRDQTQRLRNGSFLSPDPAVSEAVVLKLWFRSTMSELTC